MREVFCGGENGAHPMNGGEQLVMYVPMYPPPMPEPKPKPKPKPKGECLLGHSDEWGV